MRSSSTARCTSRCTCRSRTAIATRADLIAVFQGRASGYAYGRQGNPTTAALEAKVTRDGAGRCDRVLRDRHGGDRRDHDVAAARRRPRRLELTTCSATPTACSARWPTHGTPVSFVDATAAENVERALTPRTRLVFVETIANPRTQVADLVRIGALCRERGLIYVVDNTMTSPWLFRPKPPSTRASSSTR